MIPAARARLLFKVFPAGLDGRARGIGAIGGHGGVGAGSFFQLFPAGLDGRQLGVGAVGGLRPPASAATDDDQDPMWERPTHARILVGDNDAGRIIGKAGSSIAAMEADSGARIMLSGRSQLLAGTDRRVVFLSGPFRAVMDAAELVLHKILGQGDQVVDADATVVLVVPDACCGAFIGKGGTLIKSLAEASNAGITLSHHRSCYGFNDRLVKITGHMDNQLQAIFLILSELLDDVHYLSSYESVGFPRYHVSSIGRDGDGQDEHVERYHNRPDTPVGSPDIDDSRDVEGILTIGVANEYVGAVIGRGGRVIKEIEQATGAWIRVFKGELLPGMREREVVINGTREAVDAAEAMIAEHISYAMGRRGRKQGGERRMPSVKRAE